MICVDEKDAGRGGGFPVVLSHREPVEKDLVDSRGRAREQQSSHFCCSSETQSVGERQSREASEREKCTSLWL